MLFVRLMYEILIIGSESTTQWRQLAVVDRDGKGQAVTAVGYNNVDMTERRGRAT